MNRLVLPQLLLAGSATLLLAQQGPPASQANADQQAPTMVYNLPSQPVGVDDLLAVSVYDAPELTRTVRVGSDGKIRLPMLKEKIAVQGKLASEIETAIAEELSAESILVDPVVTVSVAEYKSRPVSVLGAVRNPVTFQAIGETSLLDAITRAQGLTPEAGPEILVTRKRTEANGIVQNSVLHIPVKGLIETADPTLNVKLTGGEEIRVPEGGKIFVAGNVKMPGAYPMQDNSDTTVLKALALSQGVLPFTAKTAYIYRKVPDSTVRSEIPIHLSLIMTRKAPDVPVLPDDILYIPDNSKRRTTASVLDRMAGFGTSTVSGVLVYGRR